MSNTIEQISKNIRFKRIEFPLEYTNTQEFADIYKNKLAKAGTWVENHSENGSPISRQWIPATTYLVCPQNRQLVLNDEVNINMIHILEVISDEDAVALELATGGKVGIQLEEDTEIQDVLTRMGISKSDNSKAKITKKDVDQSGI